MYEASEGRYGWISGQLDPRKAGELSAMIAAAEELHALAPNVMIKVPATMQGTEALEALTSKAISTNTTVCFTVSQTLEAARAVYRGTLAARKNSVDLGRWRSVITLMIGRLTEREALDVQARRAGISLSEADKRWLGLAVFKRGVQLLRDNGWPSKMLACSMREGPRVGGRMRFWDVEKLSGGNIVYTMPPYVLEPLFRLDHDLVFRPDAIDEGVPEEILDRLMSLPFGLQAYHPNGLSPDQFNHHPSTLDTIEAFSKGTQGLQEYVARRRAAVRGAATK
jgi:transaldolase